MTAATGNDPGAPSMHGAERSVTSATNGNARPPASVIWPADRGQLGLGAGRHHDGRTGEGERAGSGCPDLTARPGDDPDCASGSSAVVWPDVMEAKLREVGVHRNTPGREPSVPPRGDQGSL